MLATPIEAAVLEQEACYAEYARCLGSALDLGQLRSSLPSGIVCERRSIGADLLQHCTEHGHILDIEFPLPEPLEHAIMVGAQG